MGLKESLTVGLIIKLKIFKVTEEYVDEISKAGYPGLPAEELIKFKIFKIDKPFIEKATSFAGSRPSPEKLIQLKIAEGGDDHSSR